MKEAKKIIVYDDTCPMCNWYTGAFVKTGLLEKDGRQAFSTIDPNLMKLIDNSRAKNQIPLVDVKSNKVFYGVDALLEILGSRFITLKRICSIPIIMAIITRLYKLISYNRRTIVATTANKKGFDCTPDFNFKYRLCFILMGFTIGSLLLPSVTKFIISNSLLSTVTVSYHFLIYLMALVANVVISLFMERKKEIEYLGQIATLLIITVLLFLPLQFANRIFLVPVLTNNLYLLGMSIVVIKEFIRRLSFVFAK